MTKNEKEKIKMNQELKIAKNELRLKYQAAKLIEYSSLRVLIFIKINLSD